MCAEKSVNGPHVEIIDAKIKVPFVPENSGREKKTVTAKKTRPKRCNSSKARWSRRRQWQAERQLRLEEDAGAPAHLL